MINTKNTTHIRVSKKLRDWIDKKGKRGESFDKILRRLLGMKHE